MELQEVARNHHHCPNCIQAESSVNQKSWSQRDGSFLSQLGQVYRTNLTSLPRSLPGHWLINYKSFFKQIWAWQSFFFPLPKQNKKVKKEKSELIVLKQVNKINGWICHSFNLCAGPFVTCRHPQMIQELLYARLLKWLLQKLETLAWVSILISSITKLLFKLFGRSQRTAFLPLPQRKNLLE